MFVERLTNAVAAGVCVALVLVLGAAAMALVVIMAVSLWHVFAAAL